MCENNATLHILVHYIKKSFTVTSFRQISTSIDADFMHHVILHYVARPVHYVLLHDLPIDLH